MFKLNRTTRTKSGERVTPYLIEGRLVYAFDKNKVAKTFALEEFEINQKPTHKKLKPVIMVKGTAPLPIEDNLFNPNEGGGLGGIYEETPIVVKPPTPITTPEPDPIIPETLDIEIVADGEGIISGKARTGFVPNVAPDEIPTYIYSEEDDVKVLSGAALSAYEANLDLPTRDYEPIINKMKIVVSAKASYTHTVFIPPPPPVVDADDFYGGL